MRPGNSMTANPRYLQRSPTLQPCCANERRRAVRHRAGPTSTTRLPRNAPRSCGGCARKWRSRLLRLLGDDVGEVTLAREGMRTEQNLQRFKPVAGVIEARI